MKTIVALVDFSDATPGVIEQTQKMAKAFNAQVVILHALPKEPEVLELGLASPVILAVPSEEVVQADYARLLRIRDTLTQAGVGATVQQLREGGVGRLVEESARLNADLLVLGSHRHSAVYHWFIGNFASDALKLAHCPVLVVPSEASA